MTPWKEGGKRMKRAIALPLVVLLASIISTLASAPPAAAAVCSATYSFNLIGPQTAKDPSTSNTVRVTGAGSFDCSAAAVIGSGAFTIFNSSGSELSRGTWKASNFVSFDPFGGLNPGEQGGKLEITVAFFPAGGGPVKGGLMTVYCHIDAPSPIGHEGVIVTGTVGSFTDVVRGATLFHLNQ